MTDSIYHYVHNQAIGVRFIDIMDKEKREQMNKSGEEVVAEVVQNAGIILR